MTECPTPAKKTFRSRAAAARWHRRTTIRHKAQLHPYRCAAGHWHLTHDRPGWKAIDADVDAELAAIAARAAARYSDSLITVQGWTRQELVDAIHGRLRTKFIHMRDSGQLERGSDGRIHLTDGSFDA